jgi:5'-nucleotidase
VSGVAFSLAGGKSPKYWETAKKAVHIWMERYLKQMVSQPFLVNVNIPDISLDLLKDDIKVTRLGKRHQAEPVIEAKNPRGETVYWVGSVSSAQDASEETDFYAVECGHISLTPLTVDLTAHDERLLWDSWSKA